jgi:hypothetical protein
VAIDAVALDSDTQGINVTWSETSNSDDWSKKPDQEQGRRPLCDVDLLAARCGDG